MGRKGGAELGVYRNIDFSSDMFRALEGGDPEGFEQGRLEMEKAGAWTRQAAGDWLCAACCFSSEQICGRLLDLGADPRHNGDEPIANAAGSGKARIVGRLAQLGANAGLVNDEAPAGLMGLAAYRGDVETGKALLALGAPLREWEDGALRIAVSRGHFEFAEFLLGADPLMDFGGDGESLYFRLAREGRWGDLDWAWERSRAPMSRGWDFLMESCREGSGRWLSWIADKMERLEHPEFVCEALARGNWAAAQGLMDRFGKQMFGQKGAAQAAAAAFVEMERALAPFGAYARAAALLGLAPGEIAEAGAGLGAERRSWCEKLALEALAPPGARPARSGL